jgi:hypothetical protein
VKADLGSASKLIAALTGLLVAVASILTALRLGGEPVPAVIIIRGSTIPGQVSDGLSDSERDREWLWASDPVDSQKSIPDVS